MIGQCSDIEFLWAIGKPRVNKQLLLGCIKIFDPYSVYRTSDHKTIPLWTLQDQYNHIFGMLPFLLILRRLCNKVMKANVINKKG